MQVASPILEREAFSPKGACETCGKAPHTMHHFVESDVASRELSTETLSGGVKAVPMLLCPCKIRCETHTCPNTSCLFRSAMMYSSAPTFNNTFMHCAIMTRHHNQHDWIVMFIFVACRNAATQCLIPILHEGHAFEDVMHAPSRDAPTTRPYADQQRRSNARTEACKLALRFCFFKQSGCAHFLNPFCECLCSVDKLIVPITNTGIEFATRVADGGGAEVL